MPFSQRVVSFYRWMEDSSGVCCPTGRTGELHRRYGPAITEAAWKAQKVPYLRRNLERKIDDYVKLLDSASTEADQIGLEKKIQMLTSRKSLRFGN